ncbi:MAG: hypothetical protein WEA99_05655 [Brumimicrobium sp.]
MTKQILLFISSLIILTSNVSAQIQSITLDSSLVSHDFSVLDNAVKDKKMVFFGENHKFTNSNQLTKLKSILYLYNKGFRYMAIELGAGIGYLANEYIKTGDETIFELLNQGRPPEEKNSMHYLLHSLKRFNENKPLDEKIKIVGVDYTRYPVYSLKAIAKIIELKECQEELAQFYEDIEVVSSIDLSTDGIGFASLSEPSSENFDIRYGFKSYRNRLFELSVRNIVNDFKNDSIVFKNALGEYYSSIHKIITELDETVKWYSGDGINIQMHIERERHLEKNITSILKSDSTAKIAGQFGRCHVRTDQYNDDCYSFSMNSMIERMEKDSTLKGKILAIPIFYNQNTEIKVNKKVSDKKLNDLIKRHKLYVYNSNDSLFKIKGVKNDSGVVLINSYWSFMSMDDILEKNNVDNKQQAKRKKRPEEHFYLTSNYMQFQNNINQDLGVNLLPEDYIFYGIGFENIDDKGWQQSFSFNTIRPINKSTDSVDFRYTNWYVRSNIGYNIIYRKHFDLFANYNMTFGFAKVKEDRGFVESEYTYDSKQIVSKYRNPYFNFGLETGVRLKFGSFGMFALGGYHYDVTNPKWRLNTIIPHSRGLRFSTWYLKAGISFIY